jgi:predicted GIY-YIG superfamily endonuclease
MRSTGCAEGDRAGAETKLAEYITGNTTKVCDALSVYMVEKIAHGARPLVGIAMVENLADFFGERTIGDIDGALLRDYANQRRSQGAARRELEVLAAAINYFKDAVGVARVTTELYRYFAADGRLLYVGVSLDALRRAKQHYKTADWIVGSTSVTFERYATREAALLAEAEAIRAERPVYNIVHAVRRRRVPAAAITDEHNTHVEQ